jgi:hypothetical protein
MEARELGILGFNNQTLPNVLEPSKLNNPHLAVFLPGVAYGMTLPALYYPRMLLHSFGADEWRIEPTYRQAEWKEFSDDQKEACLKTDAKAILEAIKELGQYQRITFVAKSLGTLVLAYLLELSELPNQEFIWLTPIFKNAMFLETVTTKPHKGLFAIGSSDQHFDLALLEQVKASGGQVLVFEGANHSLEIAGDVIGSVEIQVKIVKKTHDFLTIASETN